MMINRVVKYLCFSASLAIALKSVDEVMVNFTILYDHPTAENVDAFLENQRQIALKSAEFLGSNGNFPQRPYLKISPVSNSKVPNKYDWVETPEFEDLKSHIKNFLKIKSLKQNVLQNLGPLTMHIRAINDRLGKQDRTDENQKPLVIVLSGQQSNGKSTAFNALVGYNLAFTHIGQGNRCPVYYHIHNSTSGDASFYWGTTSKNNQKPLTAKGIAKKLQDHMLNIANGNKDSNIAVSEAVHIAVYVPNPLFQGELIDCPGWVGSIGEGLGQAEDDKKAVKEISFDILKSVVNNVHKDSLFIIMEAMTFNPQDSWSIKDIISHFSNEDEEEEGPAILKKLLPQTVIAINKMNSFMEEDPFDPAKMKWKCTAGETATIVHNLNNLQDILNAARSKYEGPEIRALMIGIDVENALPFRNDNRAFDEEMARVLRSALPQSHTEPYLMGITALQVHIRETRLKAIWGIIAQVDRLLDSMKRQAKEFQSQEHTRSSAVEATEVYFAVSDGWKKFQSAVLAFVTGKYNGRIADYKVAILQGEDEPSLVDSLYQRGGLLADLGKSKLLLNGEEFNHDEKHTKKVLDELIASYGLEPSSLEERESMNGRDETKLIFKKIALILTHFELSDVDMVRVKRARDDSSGNVDGENILSTLQLAVKADFDNLAQRILDYMKKELRWYFYNVIDSVLVLERALTPSGGGQLNILDSDISTYIFRSRVRFAFDAWQDQIFNNIKSSVDHVTALAPERFSILTACEYVIMTGNGVVALPQIKGSSAEGSQDPFIKAVKFLEESTDLIIQSGITTQDVNKNIIGSLYERGFSISDQFNEKNRLVSGGKDLEVPYAKLFFNSLKLHFVKNVIMELQARAIFFEPKEGGSLMNFLNSFIFNRVGVPKMLPVDMLEQSKLADDWQPQEAPIKIVLKEDDYHKNLKDMYLWDKSLVDADAKGLEMKFYTELMTVLEGNTTSL